MVKPLNLVRPRLMRWNNNAISDHNRSAMSIDVNPIENKVRVADGTARKYWVADKHTFNVSWTSLPGQNTNTVDGYWGGWSIDTFYDSNKGGFTLELTFANGSVQTYTVMFTSYNQTIDKRGFDDLFNISVTMEEV